MQLCHHCTGTASGVHRIETFISHREGLRSLSETCQTLRASIRPFLYHWIDNYVNLNSLVRQLMDRPDLAQHVLELACFGSLPPMRIWTQLARQLHLIEEEEADFMTPADVGTRSIFYTIELLLALLPNVKKATMWANKKRNPLESGVALDCLATRAAYLDPKPCLPNLRVLTLTNMLEYERLELDPDATPILLNAAQNLRHLSLYQCYGITEEVTENLSSKALQKLSILEFDGYPLSTSPLDECEYGQTEDLVRLCPEVKDVRIKPCGVAYWDNDGSFQPFSPVRMLESLAPAKESLTSLTLDTCLATIYPDVEDLAPSLAKFSKIENLTLEEQSFCHHWLKGPLFRSVVHDPPACVTRILPQSVRQLSIVLHMDTKIVEDIIHLGKHAHEGKFQSLRGLTIILRPIPTSLTPPDLNKLRETLFRHRAAIMKAFQYTQVNISFYLGW